MSKERQSRPAGRDNRTGRLVKLAETLRRPETTTREHLPLPGFGDVKPGNKKKR